MIGEQKYIEVVKDHGQISLLIQGFDGYHKICIIHVSEPKFRCHAQVGIYQKGVSDVIS